MVTTSFSPKALELEIVEIEDKSRELSIILPVYFVWDVEAESAKK